MTPTEEYYSRKEIQTGTGTTTRRKPIGVFTMNESKLLRVYPGHVILDHAGLRCWIVRHTINRMLHEHGYTAKILHTLRGWSVRTMIRRIPWPRASQTITIPREEITTTPRL